VRHWKLKILMSKPHISVLLSPIVVLAQNAPATPSLTDMSLEELMQINVDSVYGASGFKQKITEAPASVTGTIQSIEPGPVCSSIQSPLPSSVPSCSCGTVWRRMTFVHFSWPMVDVRKQVVRGVGSLSWTGNVL
jgi:hypothetical protein